MFVRNDEEPQDWIALVEDISKEGSQVLLHINWLEHGKGRCPRALSRTDLQDQIDLETINDVLHIQKHSRTCVQQNHWCWDASSTKINQLNAPVEVQAHHTTRKRRTSQYAGDILSTPLGTSTVERHLAIKPQKGVYKRRRLLDDDPLEQRR